MKWIVPSYLIVSLEETLERIPKDLRIWRKEIRKLAKSRKKLDIKKRQDYIEHYSFYLGKIMAYVYVLELLEDYKFLLQYKKKHKIYLVNAERGIVNFKI